MALVLQPATIYAKPMKMLLYGPSFSGKTYGAIKLALGIVMSIRKCTEDEAYKHIILIDTEYRRGTLYASWGPYNYHEIKAPYYTEKLIEVINDLQNEDQIDVIITDSLTHFWVKEGGVLEQKAAKDKQGGNPYTNWLDFTAKFNKMLDILLAIPKHIICTARAKSDTVIVNEGGKSTPKTYGLKPEVRDGIEYEFDIVFNVDKATHTLLVDKGTPNMAPLYEPATPTLGAELLDLFSANSVVRPRTKQEVMDNLRNTAKSSNMITFMQLKLSGRKLDELTEEELIDIEKELLKEIKKMQKKNANSK
jgi:hypothetical protein